MSMILLLLLAAPPEGFVDLQDIPGVRFHIGYATKDNFTGAVLPGYSVAGAWMVKQAADALHLVEEDLQKQGLGLLIFDAYRPVRASLAMFAWAKRENKTELFKHGYIALHSKHNLGNTVDLTLVDGKGEPLEMGTPWDTLNERAHTENASGVALENRHKLEHAMQARGFVPYDREWWHFTFPVAGSVPHDEPYD